MSLQLTVNSQFCKSHKNLPVSIESYKNFTLKNFLTKTLEIAQKLDTGRYIYILIFFVTFCKIICNLDWYIVSIYVFFSSYICNILKNISTNWLNHILSNQTIYF